MKRLGSSVSVALTTLLACAGVEIASQLPGEAEPIQSVYSTWTNGPPQSSSWFALGTWLVAPQITGKCGIGCGRTTAAQQAAEGMNLLIGIGQNTWPQAFGSDRGEMRAIKAAGLYAIGGYNTPFAENSSHLSVASMQALASSVGATANLIGYNIGDEPDCAGDGGQPPLNRMAETVRSIARFDATRPVAWNQTHWPMQPYFFSDGPCSYKLAAGNLREIGIAAFDYYPLTNPNLIHYDWANPGILPSHYYAAKSDFVSVPNDTLYLQGLLTQVLRRNGRPNQPVWVATESGGDNLASGGYSAFTANLVSGSKTIVNASHWSRFTATWLGLSVAGPGIPAGTKLVAIDNDAEATMSAAATATSTPATVNVTGGVGYTGSGNDGDCVASANLCVVNGNEYRPTNAQVAAEVWMSIINGANGIVYFCQDGASSYFCLGDVGGGSAAASVSRNLKTIDQTVLRQAPALNAARLGLCSMDSMDDVTGALSVSNSCSDGILTMTTDRVAIPGAALTTMLDGKTYLFAQSSRTSVSGAVMTFTLAGRNQQKATIVYDSNADYDPPRSSVGATIELSGIGQFSDQLGQHDDNFQTKIYRIQ